MQKIFSIFQCTDSASSMTITGTAAQFIIGTSMTFAGTLKVPSYVPGVSIVQSGSGNSISFPTNSTVLFGGIPISITGAYSPSGQSSFNMTGSQSLVIGDGTIGMPVNVSGSSNSILGDAIISQPITLANSSATLSLGLGNGLSGNLVLNSGTVTLLTNLPIKQGSQITGPGSINCNNFSIFFPEYLSALSTNLTFSGSVNTLVLSRKILLTGTWSFTGATSILKGNGSILDLTGGGSLSVAAGCKLYISGVHIKGLGSSGLGSLTFGSSTSVIYLSDSALELSGSFTQSQGQVVVDGAKCQVIAAPGETYIVSGSTSIFTVDGQILQYITQNGTPTNPFTTASSGTISKINGGDIRSGEATNASQSLVFDTASGSGTNFATATIDLSSGASVTFNNSTPASVKTMIFDGNNNAVIFGEGSAQPFIVNQNVTLTVQNVKFQNFDPAKMLLQGSGGTLAVVNFGDGVVLEFAKSLSIVAGALNFTGNATIQGLGSGCVLTVASQGIKLTGANKILTIRNCKIKNATYNSVKINTSTAKLSLQAMDFYMTATGFTFDVGNLEFKENVNIYGASETTPEAVSVFSFTSAGIATILSASRLKFNPDTKLLYSPNVTGDGGVASVQKRHFKTTDPSSVLQMQHAYLDVGATGLALDYGKFIVEDFVLINTLFVSGKEFELGSSLNTTILNGGDLKVNGLIKYVTTTYP